MLFLSLDAQKALGKNTCVSMICGADFVRLHWDVVISRAGTWRERILHPTPSPSEAL